MGQNEQHARLAPSSLHILRYCPGSLQAQEHFALPDNEADRIEAEEGTAAHWVCSEVLESFKISHAAAKVPAQFLGLTTPNGIVITQEMVDAASMYTNYVLTTCRALRTLRVEERISCPTIHAECWGTPDASWVQGHTLYMADFKYGHRCVDVYKNWQLIAYASGLLDYYKDWNLKVVMVIVQPRAYGEGGPIRAWECNAKDLYAPLDSIRNAVEDAIGENPRMVAGKYCRDCVAAYACPVSQAAAAHAMDIAEQALPNMHVLSPVSVGIELYHCQRAKVLLDNRIKALEARAEQLIFQEKKAVANYSMEPTYSRLNWTIPNDQVRAVGSMFGLDLSKDAVITPTQAMQEAKRAGVDSSVIKVYADKHRTGLKLVNDTDNAAFVFNKIGETYNVE